MTPEWHSFLSEIRQARVDLGNPATVWYRGHSKPDYVLKPSLFRSADGHTKEQIAFHEFSRVATRLFTKRTNDWEVLFDMQHYGVPTRLLDWSEALGVAVAFALLTDYDSTSDASIFVLDPIKLNRFSSIDGIKSLPADMHFAYKGIYWEKRPFGANYPIAVYPPPSVRSLICAAGRLYGSRR